jgi:large conductance mechanosensitive channel
VGLILGAAFTSLVNSLVDDIISPPLGLAVGHASLDDLFFIIKDGKNASETYFTLEQGNQQTQIESAHKKTN